MSEIVNNITQQWPELTHRQRMFVLAYATESNAKKAAEDAGYSKKTAHAAAHKLKQNPAIVRRLKEFRAYLADKFQATSENITEQFRLIAMTKVPSMIVYDEIQGRHRFKRPDELNDGEMALVKNVTIKDIETVCPDTGDTITTQDFGYQFHDNKLALDSLARCAGMFKETTIHSHEMTGKVEHLFTFVANNGHNSETVQILDERHDKPKRKGITLDG